MNKFKFLVINDLKRVILKKGFLVANIILLIVISILINIPNMKKKGPEQIDILIVDGNTNEERQIINNTEFYNEAFKTIQTYLLELNEHKEIKQSFKFSVTQLENKEKNYNVKIIFSNLAVKDNRKAIIESDISSEAKLFLESFVKNLSHKLDKTTPNEIKIENKTLNEQEKTKKLNTTMLAIIISIPAFSIIIMGFQLCAASIINEKSSKAIENIIACVPAKTHYFSKITFSLSVVFIQLILIIFYGLIGFGISKLVNIKIGPSNINLYSIINIPHNMIATSIIYSILFILIGALSYLVLSALLASVCNNPEDLQSYQQPVVLTLVLAMYLSMYLPFAGEKGFVILRILSYFPFLSTIISPVSFASGIITWWECLLSLGINIGFFILTSYLISPIYKVSILNYSTGSLRKKIKKSIKIVRDEKQKRVKK